MKFTIILSLFSLTTLGLSKAGEIAVLIDHTTQSNTVFLVTNSTGHEIFILPICRPEQFYSADPNCKDCVSEWGSGRPVALGEWRDFIPLASGKSLTFNFDEYYGRRWRLTFIASTKHIHINDAGPNSINTTDKLEFHSAEFPPGRPYFTLFPSTNSSRN